MGGKRWKIWKWDEERCGVTGPVIRPEPDDGSLVGMDWVNSAQVEVMPVADLANVEHELRVRAARTPIPSPPLEEGKADGLEQAANLLRDLLAAPAKETPSDPA